MTTDSREPGDEPPIAKRLIIGDPLTSQKLDDQLLPKKMALPIFASDALSSVAYAPQELLMILLIGGLAFLVVRPWIAVAVVVLLVVVVISYRQLIKAYPSGGGDYEVASKNLGEVPGVVVASALLVDYVLTVAVSVASGVDNIISALPALNPRRVELAVGFVILIVIVNLRGVREASLVFALPTYIFIGSVRGHDHRRPRPHARSAIRRSRRAPSTPCRRRVLTQAAFILLVLRAFSSGCSALTGVEAVANGVPAFRKPKVRNAQATLVLMGAIAIMLFAGLTALALFSGVHYAENPCNLIGFDCANTPQPSLMAQVAAATFGVGSIPFYVIQAATACVLLLAANTAFNGFPLLGSVLARDGYAPKALNTRGDRLVFSNGMIILGHRRDRHAGHLPGEPDDPDPALHHRRLRLVLARPDRHGAALAANAARSADAAAGRRHRRTSAAAARRRRQDRPASSTRSGATLTVFVLRDRHRHEVHPRRVAGLHRDPDPRDAHDRREPLLPRRRARDRGGRHDALRSEGDVALILVNRLQKPVVKAIDYALAARHDKTLAIHIADEPGGVRGAAAAVGEHEMPMPLVIIESPYRTFASPVARFIKEYRAKHGSAVVTVYLPQYIVGHWWESLLHNRRSRRIAKQLMLVHGVSITLVPWLLDSSRAHLRPALAAAARAGARRASRRPKRTAGRARGRRGRPSTPTRGLRLMTTGEQRRRVHARRVVGAGLRVRRPTAARDARGPWRSGGRGPRPAHGERDRRSSPEIILLPASTSTGRSCGRSATRSAPPATG